MFEELKGKVCVITGGGKGIGRQAVNLFASLGCKVAVITRNRNDLDSLGKELDAKIQGNIFCFAGDVSEEKIVKSFTDAVFEKYGRIDILINNAGIRYRKEFLDITHEDFLGVLKVNVGSTFLFCKYVGRIMKEQRYGRIVNMASIVGTLGLPELTAYAASKGAIISLTKALATEWAEYNINVNVIAPGFCETSYADNFKKKKELYNFTLERTPLKRWGSSTDIANSCVFLVSSMSDYITGEVLSVDGGWSAW